MNSHDIDAKMLEYAARIAVRGHGHVEPNPCVGCVILDTDGILVGTGFHQRLGEAHAERNALTMAGKSARGSTAYITLEPCAHQGRTPPCTDALLEAGIARVVIGSRDPHHLAAGGMDVLRSQGIDVELRDDLATLQHLNAPFHYRIKTKRPWVIAKWAQTIDGAIATTTGDSKWISGPLSRRMVHRQRGRIDAILTGIGTVLADDPRLDARDVRIRRKALRVVVDPNLDIPIDSNLVKTAGEIPLLVACEQSVLDSQTASRLRNHGVQLLGMEPIDGLKGLLENLASQHDVATVMAEAGGGLIGKMLEAGLINAALIFTAPRLLGEAGAPSAARGLSPTRISDAITLEPVWAGRRGEDMVGLYHLR